jgi:hypothetical protein
MKKNKYPELEEDIIKANSVTFRFSGGDLWFRDNVSKFDDLSHCIDQMRESILNHPGKISNFVWYISYFLPDSEQLKKLKDLKIKDYEIDEDHNIHDLTPITYNWDNKTKNNILCVAEDLLTGDEDFILQVINKLSDIKKIYFSMDTLYGGFLDYYEDDEYVRKALRNDSWFDSLMNIEESYRDPEVDGKFLNDLDSLLYIKKNIDPKITFEFSHLTKKEKDILKSQDIIR